jgi:hypothetical protein
VARTSDGSASRLSHTVHRLSHGGLSLQPSARRDRVEPLAPRHRRVRCPFFRIPPRIEAPCRTRSSTRLVLSRCLTGSCSPNRVRPTIRDGSMSFLGSLFRRRDPLTQSARGADREGFAKVFATSTVQFLCVPQRFSQGLPADASQEQILAQLEEAAQDLAANRDVTPFSYEDNGRRRLPVFSTMELGLEFAKWYALRTRRLIPIQTLGVQGAAIVPAFANCDDVVLNDRTAFEYVLSAVDMTYLAKYAT